MGETTPDLSRKRSLCVESRTCGECGRPLVEPGLSQRVMISTAATGKRLHDLVSALCDSRRADLMKAAEANLAGLLHIAQNSRRRR